MGQLEDMAVFVRIVSAGSITQAAEQLSMAKSAVSRRLSDLEARLGTQLLSRTTRKSNLTEVGEQYYRRAVNILDEVDALNENASNIEAHLEGTLKMTAPLSFSLMHLSEVIHEYANRHPSLTFQLDFSDRHIDLVEEGYELAIRIAELQDSSYQARHLASINHVLCASPEYLSKVGSPTNLDSIADHVFLQYGFSSHNSIDLMDARGAKTTLRLNSKMRANNGDFLLNMAKRGHGIAYLPRFLAYKALANGELTPVLTQYNLPKLNAYAVYPKNRFLSHRCRLLIDHIAQHLDGTPYWENDFKTH
ncbi:MAG: LysR family transcriptional regulator [Porticoccaceae bacterium]